MALYVNTNVSAIDAANNLNTTERSLEKSTQQLSSGLRINSAADDAAGLTISQSLQGQINGVDQANRNTQDGISLVQTAAGALTQVQQMLQRIRELAVQYDNGTLNSTDQTAIQTEVNQLISEIQQIGTTAQFNGISVLNGTANVTFQVGANDGETISMATISLGSLISTITGGSGGGGGGPSLPWQLVGPSGEIVQGTGIETVAQMTSGGGGMYQYWTGAAFPDNSDIEVFPTSSTQDASSYANTHLNSNWGVSVDITPAQWEVDMNNTSLIPGGNPGWVLEAATASPGGGGSTFALGSSSTLSAIDAAITAVSGAASTLGAVQNRLQYTMANLSTTAENLTAANSRITDVDMASAMTSFTSEQVLQQAGTAMLTQAQKLPDAVLSLLQGA